MEVLDYGRTLHPDAAETPGKVVVVPSTGNMRAGVAVTVLKGGCIGLTFVACFGGEPIARSHRRGVKGVG